MGEISVFLYDHIPGAWEKWTLAVIAVNQKDAARYMSVHYLGGNYHYKGQTSATGKIHADCGAVTEQATEIIRQRNQTA